MRIGPCQLVLLMYFFIICFGGLTLNNCWAESPDTYSELVKEYHLKGEEKTEETTSKNLTQTGSKLSPESLARDSSKSMAKGLPKSLKDAYLAALHVSETISIQREVLTQADEVGNEALGAMFPTIVGSWVGLQQASPGTAQGASISPSEQNTTKITLTQPLFAGLKDFAALRQTKDLQKFQYFNLLNAAKQLFYDLSTAYYNVLAYQLDEKNYLIEISDNVKRLNELNQFYKIGRAQLTDVLTFQSSIASLQTSLENTRGLLAVAKEVLAYLTGWDHDFVIQDVEPVAHSPGDLDKYLAKLEQRPDVQAALQSALAYEEGIPIAFGNHLPSLGLTADYYLARPGVVNDVNWDASLALTIPIFQGGVIQSQVRQAQSVARQYAYMLSQTRRLADQEIRTFFAQLNADQRQVAKLDELVGISRKNYDTEIKYYRNGLVTNLDVIQAMATYEDAQRQFDHQRVSVQLDEVKLQAATGERPEVKVEPNREAPEMILKTSVTPKG